MILVVGILIPTGIALGAYANAQAISELRYTGNSSFIEFENIENLRERAANCGNGSITFAWESSSGDELEEVVLEQFSSSDLSNPVVRYQGTDEGSVISGLPEGVHYFRVRHAGHSGADASSVIKVNVVFFPKERLVWLLGVGALVVIATICTVLFGFIKTCTHTGSAHHERGEFL